MVTNEPRSDILLCSTIQFMNTIRNFAIIAHIDHGKSTLADRLMELTGTVGKDDHEEQLLDRNPISRERGITIKLAPVRMQYNEYTLNLIDTPGHVDFSYEVDRTLACVEGAILLVDATQGIQAQTIANAYKAIEKDLAIIPVINKIDMPSAEVDRVSREIVEFLGVRVEDILPISAKTGQNVEQVLKRIITDIPSPTVKAQPTLSALVFDSYFDPHKGVVSFVRVFSGSVKKGDKLHLAMGKIPFEALEVGIFTPDLKAAQSLSNGEIGYIVTNLKDIHDVRVGDTITVRENHMSLPGYKQVHPMIFASVFTTETEDFENLKNALEKIYLSDSSLSFTPMYSRALGPGFRVGFLGLLHADVVRERLEREYQLDLVLTTPQVDYKFDGQAYEEPIVKMHIITPNDYLGAVMRLCENHRGLFLTMDNKNQIYLEYEMPLSEMISDFFDKLKSVTSGFASFDWEFDRYQEVKADRLILLLNLQEVEEFSEIVVPERAYEKARDLTQKLKEVIPRQQFELRIQAKYKGKIIASERHAPFRKDVTAKLYGGDRTRKDKLLKKQKKGKKKMKMIGQVEIPKEAFVKLFRR